MSEGIRGRTFTEVAGETLAQGRLVKYSSGALVYADTADTAWVGVTERAAASGDKVLCAHRNAEGTVRIEADGAITQGALVYVLTDGKVKASGSNAVGYAMHAAADGEFCLVMLTA